jgi:hypothetical protein
MADDEYEWKLATQKFGAGTPSSPHQLVAKRVLIGEELERMVAASALLTELTETSAYKVLQDKYRILKDHIGIVTRQAASKSQNQHDILDINNKLDDLLSALKAFEDRTKHNISQRYGVESDVMKTFKAALAWEFDNIFAYRFCYHLRNYSQHCGAPISNIQASAYAENGRIITYCKLTMRSHHLLKQYDWHSMVKSDLENSPDEFDMGPVLEALMASCSRVYAKLLISNEEYINEACEVISQMAGEISHGEWPILVGIKRGIKQGDQLETIRIRPVKLNLVTAVNGALQQSKAILVGQ